MRVSVRNGEGVAEWFEWLKHSHSGSGDALQIDYNIYADGEALLGWLNATVNLKSNKPIDSGVILKRLADEMQKELVETEIAHLKMTLSPDDSLAGQTVVE